MAAAIKAKHGTLDPQTIADNMAREGKTKVALALSKRIAFVQHQTLMLRLKIIARAIGEGAVYFFAFWLLSLAALHWTDVLARVCYQYPTAIAIATLAQSTLFLVLNQKMPAVWMAILISIILAWKLFRAQPALSVVRLLAALILALGLQQAIAYGFQFTGQTAFLSFLDGNGL